MQSLIEFFCASFHPIVHFRTSSLCTPRRAQHTRWQCFPSAVILSRASFAERRISPWQFLSPADRCPLITDHCALLIGTSKFSQFCVSHTKQSTGPTSNRDKFPLEFGSPSLPLCAASRAKSWPCARLSLFAKLGSSIFRVSRFDFRLRSSLVTGHSSLCL